MIPASPDAAGQRRFARAGTNNAQRETLAANRTRITRARPFTGSGSGGSACAPSIALRVQTEPPTIKEKAMLFRITTEVQVEADSPEDAREQARRIYWMHYGHRTFPQFVEATSLAIRRFD